MKKFFECDKCRLIVLESEICKLIRFGGLESSLCESCVSKIKQEAIKKAPEVTHKD